LFTTISSKATRFCFHKASFIEFAAHIYLSLNPEANTDREYACITQAYIRQLAQSHDQQYMLPDVVQQLPDELKVQEFSHFLNGLSEEAEQEYFLEQARSLYSADVVSAITDRVLQLVVPGVDSQTASSAIDKLVQVQRLQPDAAVNQANLFYRTFLSKGKVGYAIDLQRRFESPAFSESDIEQQRPSRVLVLASICQGTNACSGFPFVLYQASRNSSDKRSV
jgi:hypothetical protein